MYQTSAVPEVRHSFETESVRFRPTGTLRPEQTVDETGVGAAVLVLVPVVGVLVASHPAAVGLVVALAVATFVTGALGFSASK